MLEYVVFFGLLLIGVVCYIAYELQPKQEQPPLDTERYKTESPLERILYDSLKSRGVYTKTQFPIDRYRIDLAIPRYKIAIECDGKHHLEKKQKAHDKKRDAHLCQKGWITLRFTGKTIYRDLPNVIRRIEVEIQKRERSMLS